MSNNEHCHSDFEFAGPHTTFHHQHFQMVDLTTTHCKRAMNRLNQHALPHEPKASNNELSSEVKAEHKMQVEEWTTPNYYARAGNDAKTHDSNEEGKIKTDATSCMKTIQTTKKRMHIIVT